MLPGDGIRETEVGMGVRRKLWTPDSGLLPRISMSSTHLPQDPKIGSVAADSRAGPGSWPLVLAGSAPWRDGVARGSAAGASSGRAPKDGHRRAVRASLFRQAAGARGAGRRRGHGDQDRRVGGLAGVEREVVGGPDDGGVMSVQNELSPRYRGDLDVLERCEAESIAFLPWSPLGGSTHAKDVGSRFAAFAEVGEEIDASPQEVTLAWLLRLSPVIIPIPGATRPETIASIVRSVDLRLTDDQFARLQASSPENTSMYPDDAPRSPLR